MGFRTTIRAVDLQAIRRIIESRDEAEVERVMAHHRAGLAEYEDELEEDEIEEQELLTRELEEAARGLILRNDPSLPSTCWLFPLLVDMVPWRWAGDEWGGEGYELLAKYSGQLNFPPPAASLLEDLVSVRSPHGQVLARDRRFDLYASFLTAAEGQQLLACLGTGAVPAGITEPFHGDISADLEETLRENLIPALHHPIPESWGYFFRAS